VMAGLAPDVQPQEARPDHSGVQPPSGGPSDRFQPQLTAHRIPHQLPAWALSEDLAIRTGDAKRKSAVSAFVIHATACDWKHSQASPTTTRAQQITHGRRLYRNTASSLLGVTRAGQVIADSCRHRCGEMLNVAVSAIPAPRCCA
jgi:hypothetical protein